MKLRRNYILFALISIVLLLFIVKQLGFLALGLSGAWVENGISMTPSSDKLVVNYNIVNNVNTKSYYSTMGPNSCMSFGTGEEIDNSDGKSHVYFTGFGTTHIDQQNCIKFGGTWYPDAETSYPYMVVPGCDFTDLNLSKYDLSISPVLSQGGIPRWDSQNFNMTKRLSFCNDYSEFASGTNTQRNLGFVQGTFTIQERVIECSFGQEKCEGTKTYNCVNDKFSLIGEVKGKCGVQCLSNIDCTSLTGTGDITCSNRNIVKTTPIGVCNMTSYQCLAVPTTEIIEECQYGCVDGQKSCNTQPTTPKLDIKLIIGIAIGALVIFSAILYIIARRYK